MITQFKIFEEINNELDISKINEFLFDEIEKIVHIYHRSVSIHEHRWRIGQIGYGSFSVNVISDIQIQNKRYIKNMILYMMIIRILFLIKKIGKI